jgi:pterin-4a-carbinolamine dehydratase
MAGPGSGGGKCLERAFKFKDNAQAMELTHKDGVIAEEEDDHPRIVTECSKVTLYC